MSSDLLERLKSALADRYAVESEIGRGGMATVYLAEDLKHHRKVAIKVLHPELAATLGTDRFLREIETVAGLTHPHILPLHDSGEAGGFLYYTMPYLAGESLRDRLTREGQLPVEDALRATREVAGALGHAHAAGIVHRDIKPANILLEAGHAVVADFGIARAVTQAAGERLTHTGLSAGTPTYMSPEQAAGQEVDERSDLYALGCVLWEMLAGEPPFHGPTPQVILARKATEEPPAIRGIRKTVPPALENVLAKAMATSPADRFQSADELARALQAPETVGRVRRRGRRRWRLAAGVAVAMAIGAGMWAVASSVFSDSRSAGSPESLFDPTRVAVLPFQVIGADSVSPVRELARSMGRLFEIKVSEDYGWRIAHPGTVAGEWERAGGTLEAGLPERAELQLGRELEVGGLVRGTLVEGNSSIVLAANLVDVATGESRVSTVEVEGTLGTLEQLYQLVDELIILLLVRDQGGSMPTARRLKQYRPEAVQAYLTQDYEAALAADSNLVDAALWKYAWGQSDATALRHAWEHQDRLSERGRAHLQVLAAGQFDDAIRTRAEKIAAWEAVTRRWPEWGAPWAELGHALAADGARASVPDWSHRARYALSLLGEGWWALWNLTELAFVDRDTARARDLVERFQTATANGSGFPFVPPRAPSYRWRLAILQGDTAAATQALALTPDSTWVPGFAMMDGRGIQDADRVVAAGGADEWLTDIWFWVRGQGPEWREAWRADAMKRESRVDRLSIPVFRALMLGPAEDSTAAHAIQVLEQMAGGQESPPVSPDERTIARCWLTLWRLEHGDRTGAQATLEHLAEVERPHRFVGWAALIDVQLARLEGGDVRAAALRMDSVVRDGPLNSNAEGIQNLMLAQWLRRYGEPERALAAARRRGYLAPWFMDDASAPIPEYLREEAVLAATVGDTLGAIEAYRHYFALRDSRPDHPTWAASWDSMRVEYGALTGVEVQ